MTADRATAPRILVLSGGLIHLVHQLAVVRELPCLQASAARGGSPGAGRDPMAAALREQPPPFGAGDAAPGDPPRGQGHAEPEPCRARGEGAAAPDRPAQGREPLIAVLITGVITRNPPALAALHEVIEPWFALLRQDPQSPLAALRLVRSDGELPAGPWSHVCLNNQWQSSQRDWIERLRIPELLVCGDGLGIYYRCARELRALLPSLLGLPIREPCRAVRYVLSGRQPRWHRPPLEPQPPPLAARQELFMRLVDSLRGHAADELALCLRSWEPQRPLWLCSVPNLAHQFPGERIAPGVLRSWRRHLERRHGFRSDRDRLLLIDHPKAPPQGSFGPCEQPWLAGPLRSSLPLEVLIHLLQEARPGSLIVVCGMTSALYGVRQLNGAQVVWLPLAPLWRHNPNYRRRPLEFLHRGLRLARMALLTGQPLVAGRS